jgi:hypothetical protein
MDEQQLMDTLKTLYRMQKEALMQREIEEERLEEKSDEI